MRLFKTFTIKLLLLIIIQSNSYVVMAKTEEQKYRVIKSDKEFEIRFYPAANIATVYSDADSYKDLSGSGFRKLAGYIFGGNESDTKISMTSPVHMDINNTKSAMSFVMPSSYNKESLPKPDDSNVILETTRDEYVAVIRFSGYTSDSDIKTYTGKLRKLLDENNIIYYGNFRYLGYDSPFRITGRRNEIIVSVKWEN